MIESYPIDKKVSYRKILQLKERFIKTGVLEEGVVRPIISESWKRSRKMGIDPEEIDTSSIISDDEYNRLIAENNNMIRVAKPFMDRLFKTLRSSRYVVVLYNKDGRYLCSSDDSENFGNFSDRIHIFKKICWQEKFVGTHPIALTLALKAALQSVSEEYYSNFFKGLSGSYAPIMDKEGNLLGMLGINTWKTRPHPHTLGMAIAATAAIEYNLFYEQTINELNFYIKNLDVAMNSMTDGLILTNEKKEILEVNKAAEEIIGVTEKENKFKILDSIVQTKPTFKELFQLFKSRNHWKSDEEISLFTPMGIRKCIVSLTAVKNDENNIIGWVISLKNIKRMGKLVKKMASYQARYSFEDIFGNNREFLEVKKLAQLAAKNPNHILIEGESGTGKELFAHAIHQASERCEGPFITINCSAIPSELFESTLFGYEKGSFTGAMPGGEMGKFELANEGTLLLDEIGDLPLFLQVKLLRVISENQLDRVGGKFPVPIDIRIIAITNKILDEEVKKGNFRLDLYHRLNTITLKIPPLRRRGNDIILLSEYFIKEIAKKRDLQVRPISYDFMKFLKSHNWHGNVRELKNTIERVMLFAEDDYLKVSDLKVSSQDTHNRPVFEEENVRLKEVERKIIDQLLVKHKGNKTRVARILGIGRTTLYRKIGFLN
ncbi:MAG: sigma 54-interacting transcriptional regulator [Thermodesulfobacteriota bacterium]|nr:sigma 54-interacting transcriptional regulator [Thermodesulfobacteriota bacterium]